MHRTSSSYRNLLNCTALGSEEDSYFIIPANKPFLQHFGIYRKWVKERKMDKGEEGRENVNTNPSSV